MTPKEKLLWTLIVISAIGVGLYPIGYSFAVYRQNSLLMTKPWELINNALYMTAFYTHITWGGIAIITGWSQFIKSWRQKHLTFHRYLGYLYMTAVFISSIAGFSITFFSTGGPVGGVGFGVAAVVWFTTNTMALISIKKGKVKEHERWMTRNYTLTFSAVTLRILLPLLILCGFTIPQALMIVSWLCWTPPVIGMEIYIQSQLRRRVKSKPKEDGDFILLNS